MDVNLEKRLIEIEDKLAVSEELHKRSLEKIYKYERQIKAIHDCLKNHHDLAKFHEEQLSKLRLDGDKYHEAYYQIFPERLKHDLKLLEQLDGLKSKSRNAGKLQS